MADKSIYQSPERPVRSESLKALKNNLNQKNIAIFFFDSQLTGLIQNNTAISKHFTKSTVYDPPVYDRTTSGTIFSADVWINGGQLIFSIQNLVHTFRSESIHVISTFHHRSIVVNDSFIVIISVRLSDRKAIVRW